MSKHLSQVLKSTSRMAGPWSGERLDGNCAAFNCQSAANEQDLVLQAINSFCRELGITRAESAVHLHKLDYHIRLDLDANSPRCLAVLRPLRVVLTNLPEDHHTIYDAKVRVPGLAIDVVGAVSVMDIKLCTQHSQGPKLPVSTRMCCVYASSRFILRQTCIAPCGLESDMLC